MAICNILKLQTRTTRYLVASAQLINETCVVRLLICSNQLLQPHLRESKCLSTCLKLLDNNRNAL